MSVLGTAGHVDAGKSTLVEALTGTHPDRLPVERAHGRTVDLGFAALRLADGSVVSFVDVPGHVRYLRNMLAGAANVAGVVFVVAATDGWRAQSQEHLEILGLLGIHRGIVVISKAALVGSTQLDEVTTDVRARLRSSGLSEAPILGCDPVSGVGTDDVRQAVLDLAAGLPVPADNARPRLWIDRAFSLRGPGTVVTGVLDGGAIGTGDQLDLSGSGLRARVRSLQHHGTEVQRIGPGERVAVGLAGVATSDIPRGTVLCHLDQWHLCRSFDATMVTLSSLGTAVGRRGAYELHVGSARRTVRLRVLGRDELPAGSSGMVRVHLDSPLVVCPGDRFVLRERGRDRTVGGGEVLELDPMVRANRARPSASLAHLVSVRGPMAFEDASTRLAWPIDDHGTVRVGRWVLSQEQHATIRRTLSARCHADGVHLSELDAVERAVAVEDADLRVDSDGLVRARADDPSSVAEEALLAAMATDPLAPVQPSGPHREVASRLVRRGALVRCGTVLLTREALDDAIRRVHDVLAARPDGATTAELKALLGTTRRFAIPILEWLDGTARTRRQGDLRTPGPRSGRPIDAMDGSR